MTIVATGGCANDACVEGPRVDIAVLARRLLRKECCKPKNMERSHSEAAISESEPKVTTSERPRSVTIGADLDLVLTVPSEYGICKVSTNENTLASLPLLAGLNEEFSKDVARRSTSDEDIDVPERVRVRRQPSGASMRTQIRRQYNEQQHQNLQSK